MGGGGVGTGKLRAGELIEIRCWQLYDLKKKFKKICRGWVQEDKRKKKTTK